MAGHLLLRCTNFNVKLKKGQFIIHDTQGKSEFAVSEGVRFFCIVKVMYIAIKPRPANLLNGLKNIPRKACLTAVGNKHTDKTLRVKLLLSKHPRPGTHTASNRTFLEPKNAAEEIEIVENSVPKSTRSVNKWAMKIFGDCQK